MERVGRTEVVLKQHLSEGESSNFYPELDIKNLNSSYAYDLFCKQMEQVSSSDIFNQQHFIREDVEKRLVEVIRLFEYYPIDSPLLVPRSDYMRYLFWFCLVHVSQIAEWSSIYKQNGYALFASRRSTKQLSLLFFSNDKQANPSL